jgi:hypothetical protein
MNQSGEVWENFLAMWAHRFNPSKTNREVPKGITNLKREVRIDYNYSRILTNPVNVMVQNIQTTYVIVKL